MCCITHFCLLYIYIYDHIYWSNIYVKFFSSKRYGIASIVILLPVWAIYSMDHRGQLQITSLVSPTQYLRRSEQTSNRNRLGCRELILWDFRHPLTSLCNRCRIWWIHYLPMMEGWPCLLVSLISMPVIRYLTGWYILLSVIMQHFVRLLSLTETLVTPSTTLQMAVIRIESQSDLSMPDILQLRISADRLKHFMVFGWWFFISL